MLPALGLNDGNTLFTRASQWVLSNVRTLSATKVNDFRFGYNSLFNNITQQLAGIEDVSGAIGIPVKVTDKNSWGVPNIGLNQPKNGSLKTAAMAERLQVLDSERHGKGSAPATRSPVG